MSKMFNRAKMTITSTGTGALTLGSAPIGYQTFASSGVANGDTVSYTIEDGANWEVGTGVYTAAGTTLSRTVTQSYNGSVYGTSAISVTTAAIVFITALAADLSLNALPGGPLNVANGGTGLTSLTAGYIPYGNGTGAFGTNGPFWDSTNSRLGVKTASPSAILDVVSGGTSEGVYFKNSDGDRIQFITPNRGTTYSVFGLGTGMPAIAAIGNGATLNMGIGTYGAGYLVFGTDNTERMRLDASGNLGLGVTPSAWPGQSASYYVLQTGKTALYDAGGGAGRMTYNGYVSSVGTNTYIATGYATRYDQNAGQHIWYNAPSGTAGSAITFAQAMTLDASGQLIIGNTSGSAPLHVYNAANSGWGAIVEKSAGSGTPNGLIAVVAQNSSSNYILAAAQGSYASPNYKFVVTGAGDVGIGTNSPAGNLDVFKSTGALAYVRDSVVGSYWGTDASSLCYFGTNGSYPLTFRTNGSEKARIEASGNLLVGTTSTSNTVVGWKFLPAVNGSGFICDTTGDGPTISVTNLNATIANGYRWFSFRINSGGTQAGSISYNTGTSQVNYNQTSDRRIKSNITPALPVLEKMKQVEVVSFDMGQGHTDYGVIAQDLHKLFPEAVSVGDDLDEPETLWGFAGASLVPAMVKAIQELAAKVSALEAKQ